MLAAALYAPAHAAEPKLTVQANARVRYESLSGEFRPGLSRSDQAVTLRSGVLATLDLAPLSLGGEVIDSRAYFVDKAGAFAAGDVNAFEPVQLYATVSAGSTAWTAGRFTQDLGSRRLVARSRSGNAPRSFVGARGVWRGGGGESLTALYVMPVQQRPDDLAATLHHEVRLDRTSWDNRLFGAFYTSRGLAAGLRSDAYVLRLLDVDGPRRSVRDRRLTTMGARLFRTPHEGAPDIEVEAMWQTGRARATASARDLRDLEVNAGYLHAEVGYTFEARWSPRLELAYDYGTGDDDAADGKYGRFDALYGSRRGDFGPGGLYGPVTRSNVSSPSVRMELSAKRWEGYLAYRPIWLAEARDAFGSTGVRDATGHIGRFAGHQVEGRLRRRIGEHLQWETGGGWLVPEGVLEHASNSAHNGHTLYGYTDLTATF